jgi:hypothetical protein
MDGTIASEGVITTNRRRDRGHGWEPNQYETPLARYRPQSRAEPSTGRVPFYDAVDGGRWGVRKTMVAVAAIFAVAVAALFGVADATSQGTFALSVDANRYAGPRPLRVTFSAAASQATGAVRYRWCFDEGSQSQDQNPTHSFRRAGYYTVVVQAQDESGDQERQSLLLGAWPPKQWAAAKSKPLTKKVVIRAQRAQQRRTRKRRKQLQRRHGLTLKKCTSQSLQ